MVTGTAKSSGLINNIVSSFSTTFPFNFSGCTVAHVINRSNALV